jgi:uroporphyrinogen-III decarboxylase
MTSRERVLQVLNHGVPDRVPTIIAPWGELIQELDARNGAGFSAEHASDVIEVIPPIAFPASPMVQVDGISWFTDPIIQTYDELDDFIWPDPDDPAILEPLCEANEKYPDKAILFDIIGPITHLHGMRLMDNIYIDMLECPEKVHKAIRRIADISLRVLENALSSGLHITAIYMLDDIASSKNLLISPKMLDEFLFDYLKPGIQMVKAAKLKLFYHSDGNLTKILEHLANLGFDAVNPMQIWFNDLAEFHTKYRNKLTCYGGVDNTHIVSFGTPQEIRDHIQWLFEHVGKDGGLIFGWHMVDPGTPRENLLALFESIAKCRYN